MKKSYIALILTGAALLSSCGQKVEEIKVTSLQANFNESKTYLVGDKITKNDITVKATYSDGNVKTITDWTCPELNAEYTVSESDGAARKKEFTISFSEVTTKASTDAFDGKVTKEEYNNALLYVYNGNEGKAIQNYTLTCYGDEMVESKIHSVLTVEDKVGHNQYETEESYYLYDNACTKLFRKTNDKYYVSQIFETKFTQDSIPDFCHLTLSGEDPRAFDKASRTYSYQDAEYGEVKSSFSYLNGNVRLNYLGHLFEGTDYHYYAFKDYGSTKVTLPEYNGLIKPTKAAGKNEYVHNLPNFGTDVKKYCFEIVLEEAMQNAFFKFYATDDTTEAFAMYYYTLVVNGETVGIPVEQENGVVVSSEALAKGSTIQVMCQSFQPASGHETAEHVFKLIELVK